MKTAGPDHSNIILVLVIASVLGIAIYGATLWFGGWRALIGLGTVVLIFWLLVIIFNRDPPRY